MIKEKEENFIKIPRDFKSIHDLKDLVNNYAFFTKLSNALNEYQFHYLSSFLMTKAEVLKYIPKNQQKDYRVYIRQCEQRFESWDNYKKDKTKEDGWARCKDGYRIDYVKPLTLNKMLTSTDKKDKKIFIVDTINKKINVCIWAIDVPKKGKFNYTGAIEYFLDDKTRELLVHIHYTRVDSQAVGGVWINGMSGYLSGETYNDYTLKGEDVYSFCTKTNKYLGLKNTLEEPERLWMDTSGSY